MCAPGRCVGVGGDAGGAGLGVLEEDDGGGEHRHAREDEQRQLPAEHEAQGDGGEKRAGEVHRGAHLLPDAAVHILEVAKRARRERARVLAVERGNVSSEEGAQVVFARTARLPVSRDGPERHFEVAGYKSGARKQSKSYSNRVDGELQIIRISCNTQPVSSWIFARMKNITEF